MSGLFNINAHAHTTLAVAVVAGSVTCKGMRCKQDSPFTGNLLL